MHDLRATRLAVERALNGFHLPANAAHPVQKLLLFGNGVVHAWPFERFL